MSAGLVNETLTKHWHPVLFARKENYYNFFCIKCTTIISDTKTNTKKYQIYFFRFPSNFPFRPWTVVHGSEKIELNKISSKNSCK